MTDEKAHPLKGYYLTRFYNPEVGPLAVISDLAREEAVAICEKVSPNRHVDVPGQDAYVAARIEVENWLRESARASGIDIRSHNPVYFALTDHPEESVPGRRVISIPVEQLNLSSCSFTFDDSFANCPGRKEEAAAKAARQHPLNGAVLNTEQAAAAIKTYGLPGKGYHQGERYVEVQMWDRPQMAIIPEAVPAASPAKISPVAFSRK